MEVRVCGGKIKGKTSPGHVIGICLFNLGTIRGDWSLPYVPTFLPAGKKLCIHETVGRTGLKANLKVEKPLWPLPRFELLNFQSVAQSLYRVHNAGYMALGLGKEQ